MNIIEQIADRHLAPPVVYPKTMSKLNKFRRVNVPVNQTQQKLKWADCIHRVAVDQDKAAFTELFNYFAPRLKSFLMKGGADPVQAEECAQEAMVIVWRKSASFDPTRASASTWIFTIARNKRIDILRKQNRPEPEDLPWMAENEPSAAGAYELQQDAIRLASAVKELPEGQREMITRAFYGDLTHQEIANETGLPLGTIKSRIRLALERLRHNMK